MKKVVLFFIFIFFLVTPSSVFAQTSSLYTIKSFHSEINIEENTSLTVKETIEVNFPNEKHGIFRVIPVVYSAEGKTIKANQSKLVISMKQ